MTPNPSYIESQEKSLKRQCLWLHLGCNLSLIVGLGVTTLPPYLTNNYIIRYSCLLGGFILGCNVVLTSSQLLFVSQKAKALEKAVKENFGLDLVTTQMLLEDQYKARLLPQNPEPEHIPERYEPQPIVQNNEIQEDNSEYLEIEQSKYDGVLMALERGDSDSVIIQDVLGYKGRKYQQGKVILAEIKEQSGYE